MRFGSLRFGGGDFLAPAENTHLVIEPKEQLTVWVFLREKAEMERWRQIQTEEYPVSLSSFLPPFLLQTLTEQRYARQGVGCWKYLARKQTRPPSWSFTPTGQTPSLCKPAVPAELGVAGLGSGRPGSGLWLLPIRHQQDSPAQQKGSVLRFCLGS